MTRPVHPASRCATGLLLVALTALPAVGQEDTETTPSPPADPATEQAAPEPGPDFQEVNELVREARYEEAEEALAAMQESFPDDPGLLLMRGEVLLALGRAGEARDVLQRGVDVGGDLPRMNFQLATALVATGEFDGALAAFAREIEVDENAEIRTMARLNRYMLFDRAERWDEAAAELEAVLLLQPERVEVFGDLASLLLRAGETERAAEALDRGRAAGFSSAAHYYSLGARMFSDEQHEAAVSAFSKALEIDPALAQAERSLAAALDKLGREEAAVEHLRRYLELKPDAPEAAAIAERIEAAGD
jgi:tetratricopeptide (TPR) repeat protein